ncbi:MAG: cell division protein ZapA [Thermosediminibacterales bacterium]|nr:cell division protein ZapA [Thermosediminibacterales bacterium]MDK2835471.1 cell division protein ZapA [Thermosediminibacterales bacterium]
MNEDNKNRVKVTIYGEEYYMKGHESPEYIKMVCDFVDKTMKQISEKNPHLGALKVAVLTALNIADKFLKTKEEFEELLKMVEEEKTR